MPIELESQGEITFFHEQDVLDLTGKKERAGMLSNSHFSLEGTLRVLVLVISVSEGALRAYFKRQRRIFSHEGTVKHEVT
jgi:hypothetical protein